MRLRIAFMFLAMFTLAPLATQAQTPRASASQTITIIILPDTERMQSAMRLVPIRLEEMARAILVDTVRSKKPRVNWSLIRAVPLASITAGDYGEVTAKSDQCREGERYAILTREGSNIAVITIMSC